VIRLEAEADAGRREDDVADADIARIRPDHAIVGADYGVIGPNPRDIGVSDVILTTARVRFSF